MLYTSNKEFDLERRVHLTNEIPPYDMFEALNPALQYTVDERGETVPTIWKWVLGSSKVGFNLPYAIRREDEDGEYEDNTSTASIVGRFNVVRDEPDEYGDSPIDNNDVYFKSVNGKLSQNYGPKIEVHTTRDTSKYPITKADIDAAKLNTKYHSLAIDGVWLPEFDLLLHENYRYLENLYPDHPDYRFLLTDNEMDDSFTAAGAVVDYRPNNKFFNKVAQSLNVNSRVTGDSMTDDEIEQEAIKIKIRNLRNNAFRRKYYGSKIGYKMLGGDIFNNVTVYPVATYLPIKDVSVADLEYEKRIRENLSDESAKEAELAQALNERNEKVQNAIKARDEALDAEFHRWYDPLKAQIDVAQEFYVFYNEKFEKTKNPTVPFEAQLNEWLDADPANRRAKWLLDWGDCVIYSSDFNRYKWHEDTNTLVRDENGQYKAQFDIRSFYDYCYSQFEEAVEAIYTNQEYLDNVAEINRIFDEAVEAAEKEYEAKVAEIEERYGKTDTLKEWNKAHGLNLSPKQFLEYCRKNNRIIDTFSELYYRKFRLIDWEGDKNALPQEDSNVTITSGTCLPFYSRYIFINDTKGIYVNDIIEKDEQTRELTYITDVYSDRVKTTQENAVDYKTLYLYNKPSTFELTESDQTNLGTYNFKVQRVITGDGVSKEVLNTHILGKKYNNWIDTFYSSLSTETKQNVITPLSVCELNNKIYPEPHFALTQYSDKSEIRGERNYDDDLIYPIEDKVDATNYYVSKYNILDGDQLPEVSVISSFRKGVLEFDSDESEALMNAFYKCPEISGDQRYAVLVKNENGNEILMYGTPKFIYEDSGLAMKYIRKAFFYITGIPQEKPDNFCQLTGSDKTNRDYFFGESFEFEGKDGEEKTQEKLLVHPECKVVGIWEARVVTTLNTDGTQESYHKTQWAKVNEVVTGKIVNFNLGYFNLYPVVTHNTLDESVSREVAIPLSTLREQGNDTTQILINICEEQLPVEFLPKFTAKNSIINDEEYTYEEVENADSWRTEVTESILEVFDNKDNVQITTHATSLIDIECVLDSRSEDLSNTLRFENETAKKVMKTLSIGDCVYGTGIDTDDNDVFITKISDDTVTISSPVQETGTFVLTFKVKKNMFPSSIYDKPEYFKREIVKFGTYEKLNPYKHGLYGSAEWPFTSKAIIDGLADISFYDDYKLPLFPTVMTKCHELVNKSLDENGKHLYKLIPSTIKFMNDLFVDLNVSRLLAVDTHDKKKNECLMSVDWLDYFSDNLSDISRATEKTNIGAHLTMQTDTTGLCSNESGREFTDPNIKLKFITMNWDDMQMWPEVKDDQTEWTVPAYAQIGTNGDGYRKLFRNIDEITWPNVWGATNYDDVMPSKLQKEFEREGGVLRKRGTWGQDQNYVPAEEEKDKKYYYSVEEPVFEVPLGEYDTQINCKFDINDVKHALTRVQASFYKEVFNSTEVYTPLKEDDEENTENKISMNPTGSLDHNFITSSVSELQIAGLQSQLGGSSTRFATYTWVYKGDWTPDKKDVYGKYQVAYPEVEDVEGQIQYYTIWKGAQLNGINGDNVVEFEDHTIIFKKPDCDWEYRNFMTGGIYGDGILTFGPTDTQKYIDECREAYKSWVPNPHMKLSGDFLVSITRWLLAVSDMGAYLNLNAVDQLTFEDNLDLLDEYRNLDDLVWTSDDVDHAMDTTCYWFTFAGSDPNSTNNFGALESHFGWVKGDMFGIIRDNEGEYHVLNFNKNNQFSITMPLRRSQGQAYGEFDFVANDSKYGLISRAGLMNSTFSLPRKFITPGSYNFDFTLDQRFTGEGYLYGKNDAGEWSDEKPTGDLVHFNISRSNIYYDSTNDLFYTYAELWNETEKKFEEGLSKVSIKFNENKFFKNTLTSVVSYSVNKELKEGEQDISATPTVEAVSSIPFAVEKLSPSDRILEIKEVLLRSIWNKTLEPTFFSNYLELGGKIKTITDKNEIILGAESEDQEWNFNHTLAKLTPINYIYNTETQKYEVEEGELPTDFTTTTSPIISKPRVTYSEIAQTGDEIDVLKNAEFKYYKNNLILKGKVNLENPAVVYSNSTNFISALSQVQSGDSLVDGRALSATSEKVKVKFNFVNKYGNPVRSSFKCQDLTISDGKLVSVSSNGIILYNKELNYNGEATIQTSEINRPDILAKQVECVNGDWIISANDGMYQFFIDDADENPNNALSRIWHGDKVLKEADVYKDGDFHVDLVESPYNVESNIYIVQDDIELVYSNGHIFIREDEGWRDVEIADVANIIITQNSIIARTTNALWLIDIADYEATKLNLFDVPNATDVVPRYDYLNVVNGRVFVAGHVSMKLPKEDGAEGETEEKSADFIKFSETFGCDFESIEAEHIEQKTISYIKFDNDRYLIKATSGANTYFWECKQNEEKEYDLSKFTYTDSISEADILPESNEKQLGPYTFGIEDNGDMYIASYKQLDVVNGFFVVSTGDNSIKFNTGITSGFGVGTIDVLIALRTAADIQNQFDFIDRQEDIYNVDGSFMVKEVSEVGTYNDADRFYSMNEIEETNTGYKSVKQDTEYQYYVYSEDKVAQPYINDFGNKIKLCSKDGKQLLLDSLKSTKERRNIEYGAFKNASEPVYHSLSDASNDENLREEFEAMKKIIWEAPAKYLSKIDTTNKTATIVVDDLSKNLGKIVDEVFYTKIEDVPGDHTNLELKPLYYVDTTLTEDLTSYILESSNQSVPDDGNTSESQSSINAVWDNSIGGFLLKDNIYFNCGLNIPYTSLAGTKKFSMGTFEDVSKTEDKVFDSPVTGVYLPEKGYGGHRENFKADASGREVENPKPWEYHKPWDFDPLAFASDSEPLSKRYLTNEDGTFVYVTDKFGQAVESENCEMPIFSNGSDLTINKEFFGDLTQKTIKIQNSWEKSELILKYLPFSQPKMYSSCEKLILGNTPFDISLFFSKGETFVKPTEVHFYLIDTDENTIDMDGVFKYFAATNKLSYSPAGSSANPLHLLLKCKFEIDGQTFNYDYTISVLISSASIASQPSVIAENPTFFYKNIYGKYNFLSYDNLNPSKLHIDYDSQWIESWADSIRPLSAIKGEQTRDLNFRANDNVKLGTDESYFYIPLEGLPYSLTIKLPCIEIGEVNAFYSEVKNDIDNLNSYASNLKLVLLNLVSRINGAATVHKEGWITQVQEWIKNIIGGENVSPYKVTIFGEEYSTDSTDSAHEILTLNEFIEFASQLSGGKVVAEAVKDIITLLWPNRQESFSNHIMPQGDFNEAVFGTNGSIKAKVDEFYSSITWLTKFADKAKNIRSCYINETKISPEYRRNGNTVDVIYHNKVLTKIPVSIIESAASCGYYFVDETPDVFVTDKSTIHIHVYNSLNEPLIISGIKGRIICRRPTFNTFKTLVDEYEGLGYVIDVGNIISNRTDKGELKSTEEVGQFDLINAKTNSATFHLAKEDTLSIMGTTQKYIKMVILTQKTIPTTELMFAQNDKTAEMSEISTFDYGRVDDSYVQVSENEIIQFPPDRVWFHRDENRKGDGFPIPPKIIYNPDGTIKSALHIENNYAYYSKGYENSNEFPVYECDAFGRFVKYTSMTDEEENAELAIREKGDTVSDLYQPRRPLYQTCKEWFKSDFYLKGAESNPFWQVIQINSFFNSISKDWEQVAKTYEYKKTAKGMKLTKIDDKDRYVILDRASLYKETQDGIIVEPDQDFVDIQNGKIRFIIALNDEWAKDAAKNLRIVKYGINAFNSYNSSHNYNTENSRVINLKETAVLHSYLTSKYTVNSKENLVSSNDRDAAIVPITEIGLFNKKHQMIAYAHFPPIEYRSDTQHLDFTMFIYNGIMK